MAVHEVQVIDKIEVLENGNVQVRRADRVLRDDEVVTVTYHRHVLRVGDDLSLEDPRVQVVAKAVWNFNKTGGVARPR